MIAPGIAATALICVTFAWNGFFLLLAGWVAQRYLVRGLPLGAIE